MFQKSYSIIAIPPGATIKEQLEYRNISQKNFAVRMALSEKHISQLINGEVQLTHDVAERLEMVLGMPSSFWNNLEAIYRSNLIKIEAEKHMASELELSKKYPYNAMVKNKWIAPCKDEKERLINLRKFFEVTHLDIINNDDIIPRIACRRLRITEKANYALIAWTQKVRREARNIKTMPINIKALNKLLPEIRNLTCEDFISVRQKLLELLSTCGVAIVFLHHIGGSFLAGATFKEHGKIIMGLTDRGKYSDIFWFNLFHEIGHILHKHIDKRDGTSDDDENTANEFARNILIPPREYKIFLDNNQNRITRDLIKKFADEIGIDIGIVIGRLQNDKKINPEQFNQFRKQYVL